MPDKPSIKLVNEIYVAVFPVSLPGAAAKAETILAGYQHDPDHPDFDRVRATVETNRSAIPDLVDMCDTIVQEQDEITSFRLLKFDHEGIHELDPKDFRNLDEITFDPAASWRHLA